MTPHGFSQSASLPAKDLTPGFISDSTNPIFGNRNDPLNGGDHTKDPSEKGLISTDGQHPNELAGDYFAELLSTMGFEAI